ncbi:hypothetical protein F4818DRAFT_152102 [Hypoxylon cercidicola]|nr:hypothetical protein F4818DRAFT_152102 [Hypoxylon cercidicola]
MDTLREEAREIFLSLVESRSPECRVFDIQGSGSNLVAWERAMHMDEVPAYLRSEAGQPVFKLVVLHVRIWYLPRQQESQLAWVPDIAAELGIDPYFIGMIPQDRYTFQASEQKTCEEGRVLSVYINSIDICTIASYNEATCSTICIILSRQVSKNVWDERHVIKFLRQNKALFQSPCFLPFSILATGMNQGSYQIRSNTTDWGRLDADNLHRWEVIRNNHCWGQRILSLCREVARHLRKQLDASRDSDTLREDVVAGNAGVRAAFDMIEPWVDPIAQDVEWVLQSGNEYMARVSRALMRQDTDASMELARLSVELTKAAKADSSSMKVIAVMTMIFLPGTFFAALFAIPSLSWDNQDVVGDKFWIYWAFTIPFTLVIFLLWLTITQRSQMKSLIHAGKEQWSAKSHLIRRQLVKREGTASEERPKDV